MPVSLSHLAEVIVSEMADRQRMATIEALGLTAIADLDHVESVKTFAYHECKLARHHGYIFDGANRVDVVLWIHPTIAVALELKLGATRLTKTRIDNEFLLDCRTSHKGTRIAGNMMAILDRRFGGIAPEEGLNVEIGDGNIELSREWFVVTRQSILNKWIGDARPDFSPNTSCVTIGALVTAFGGKQRFNDLVGELLAIDYFDEWVN
ncbi:hypothetical protein LOC67_24595 [Stieleria sp. JC731]|uniref:hypothetical protein n=1 Tax=Pirellulaceae TaxID=2691357 RepID=UPI001E36928A|nr:hypothetical protein [Stieleria sp. JC731]MCC9603742.1 hypothetical protein [Stieleria sp. JC731]